MNYKYTIIEGLYILIVEDVEFVTIANGKIFKEFFAKNNPESEGNLFIGYKNVEGAYVFDSKNNLVNMDAINNIPDEEWTNEKWS